MHELITSVASVIILSLFVIQFALSENLYLELSACERLISDYELGLDAGLNGPESLEQELDRIPNVSAEILDGKVELTFSKIVVPAWSSDDNTIRITRELKREEPYYDTGSSYSDEYSAQGSE